MRNNWSTITFLPGEHIVAETVAAWKWLIPDPWKLLLCSMFGAIFFERQSGGVFWLDCPTGDITRVANSAAEFHAYLAGPRDDDWALQIEEWFVTGFVGRLRRAGKIPGPGHCYGFTILPVFEEGTYTEENVFVVPVREWLIFTAQMHKKLLEVPEGSQIRIRSLDNSGRPPCGWGTICPPEHYDPRATGFPEYLTSVEAIEQWTFWV